MAEEMMMNTAPIPGQSLTKEPGNAPYERPPEISDPEQALMGYLNYLNNAKVLEGMAGLLEEEGYDVTTLVEGLAIKEPIINFVVNIMDAIDIEYKVGDIDDNDDDEDEDDLPLDLDSDDLTNQEEEPMDEPIEEEVEGPIQKGLMERGQ